MGSTWRLRPGMLPHRSMEWRRFRVVSGGGGGGGTESAIFIWPHFWWAKAGNSSVASFLVLGGGGASSQMYRHKKNHIHVTYMHERAPQKHIGLLFSHMVWRYFKRQYRTKHWHWENLWINYASERAWKLFPFSHSKTAISFNILLVGTSDTLSQKHIYFQVSNYISYTINAVPCYYGMALYINDSYVYRQNTNIEKIYASELRKFSRIFTF